VINITLARFENRGPLKATALNSILTLRSANFINTGTTEETGGGDARINP